MLSRVLRSLAVAAVVVIAVVGCAPTPEPSEPAPRFTSEAEAFAAAEETYRAYVDALNQVDLSDPETFEAVYAWTTGELNASDRTNFSNWHADQIDLVGDSSVSTIEHNAATLSPLKVDIDACYDVSRVDVRDSDGVSIVASDRPAIQRLQISLVHSLATPTSLAISSIGPSSTDTTC